MIYFTSKSKYDCKTNLFFNKGASSLKAKHAEDILLKEFPRAMKLQSPFLGENLHRTQSFEALL